MYNKLRSSLIITLLILVSNIISWGSYGGGYGNKPQEKEIKKDLYKILELTKKASKEEIKKQYRKLTRKYHPDKNPEFREKFQEITEAYEILSEAKRRRVYDTKGYSAAKSFDPNQGNGGDDMDILSRFFGGSMKRENKMEDVKIKLKVSLSDLYNGKELDYKYTRNVICPHCRGTGAESDDDIHTCPKCRGQGVTLEQRQLAPGYVQQFQRQCSACGGKGKIIKKQCTVCQGSKIIPSIEDLSVFVEKGMKNGQEIVFEDAADESADKNPGNLVFSISEGRHNVFRRENDDLHAEMNISLKQALLGFERTITHLDKRDVSIARDEVTQPGYVLKLMGEGMPKHEHSGEFGNLYVKFNVEIPRVLNESQKKLLEELFSRRSNW